VADLVVAKLAVVVVLAVVAVVVREAAVPSSPRWWCWSPIAAVALVVVVAVRWCGPGGCRARRGRGGRARGRGAQLAAVVVAVAGMVAVDLLVAAELVVVAVVADLKLGGGGDGLRARGGRRPQLAALAMLCRRSLGRRSVSYRGAPMRKHGEGLNPRRLADQRCAGGATR
jgi:hypothetical protein